MSKPTPARYRTTHWSSDTAALRKRGSLLIWLTPHDGSPGRPAVFSDAAIQFSLTIKVLFKLPLRQTTGMVASLLKMANLDWSVPDDTILCRRQKTLAVQIPYQNAQIHGDDRKRPPVQHRAESSEARFYCAPFYCAPAHPEVPSHGLQANH